MQEVMPPSVRNELRDHHGDQFVGLAQRGNFFDLDYGGFEDDLSFYENLARRCERPILELGAGTGQMFEHYGAGVRLTAIEPRGATCRWPYCCGTIACSTPPMPGSRTKQDFIAQRPRARSSPGAAACWRISKAKACSHSMSFRSK